MPIGEEEMPSKKEIEAMLNRGNRERYIYTIKRIVDFGKVWVLEEDGGYAMSGDANKNSFLVIWPMMEYAAICATGEWEKYTAKGLNLDYFMHNLLPQLKDEKVNIGVFVTPSTASTPVVTAENMLLDLDNECAKYGDDEFEF